VPRGAREGLKYLVTWSRMLRLLTSKHLLALTDQAVVSGTSFLTLIIVARCTDAGQLGIFAIGISVIGVLTALQHSSICLPYSIQRHDHADTAAEHAFAALAQSALLAAVAGVTLASAGLVLSIVRAPEIAVTGAWALAAVVPLVVLKEFAREFAFAHLKVAHALILDVCVAAMQLSALAWLAWNGRMTPLTAFGAIGVACLIPVLCWLLSARARFSYGPRHHRLLTAEGLKLGRWLALSTSAGLVQGYSIYWLSMAIAGAAVTGIYAACMSVASFANPVIYGLYNFLAPRSVLAWKEDGGAGLRLRVIKDSLMLGALMSAFLAVILLAGDMIVGLLYPGPEYRNLGHIVTVLAAAMLVSAIGVPASNALANMQQPRPIAALAGISVTLNVVLVCWFLIAWGLPGAAYAFLITNVVVLIGRWSIFLKLVGASHPAVAGLDGSHRPAREEQIG
jgi:O-antigen/teichoic acid export membrane protein